MRRTADNLSMADPSRAGRAGESRLVWLASITAGLLFAVLIAGMWQFMRLQSSLDRQAMLSTAAFAQHDRLLQIVNEETGVRGYVATGNPGYLQIYYTSQQAWALDTARIFTTQNALPVFQPRVRRSIVAARNVQQYFQNEIELMRDGRATEAKAQLSQGKRLVDRLRALDNEVQQTADAELEAQRNHTKLLAAMGVTASLVLCCVLALWLGAFAIVLRRAGNYRLSALRDALTGAQNRSGALMAIDAQIGAAQENQRCVRPRDGRRALATGRLAPAGGVAGHRYRQPHRRR